MKEIYLTIGILQVLVSVSVSIYLTLLWIQKYQYPNKIFSIIHGLSTILMGILYIISFAILSRDETFRPVLDNEIYTGMLHQVRDPEYTNSFKSILEDDIKKFDNNRVMEDKRLSYHPLKEHFKKAIKIPSNYMLQNHFNKRSRELHYITGMNSEETLYLYLFLIYSFVHGMVYVLMSSTHFVSNTLLKETTDKSIQDSRNLPGNTCSYEIPDKENSVVKIRYFIVLMVFFILFVPMICSGLVVVMMNNIDVSESNSPDILNTTILSNDYNTGVILNHTNISLHTEVDSILNKIYNIMKDLNITQATTTSNISFISVPNENIQQYMDEGVVLRSYLFILLVLGYILTIFYLRNSTIVKSMDSLNTKLSICFTISWFPAVVEVIVRKYIANTSPSVISQIMLLFGTFHQILINIINMYATRKFMKKKNFVVPNMQKINEVITSS